ncbi:MAG: sigma-70 family RNA polymerase sigma factor [Acidobacteria bacterium]|nr:sigma-70 family RNA polymerase sigma factor [Acidobacteriota bacterium]
MLEWPPLTEVYTDEYGNIDPLVYHAAGELWPQARVLALAKLGDWAEGHRLLLKAVVNVSAKQTNAEIHNLQDYLFAAYRHNVFAALKKAKHRQALTEQRADELQPTLRDPAAALQTAVLIEELRQRMDEWTKEVFEWMLLGYTSEEIGKQLGMSANHVRSKFDKRVKKLQKQIDQETRTATTKAVSPPQPIFPASLLKGKAKE